MVEYKKSKKGYFYKVVRGKSVRISEKEFKRKKRVKKNKTPTCKRTPPKISAKKKKAILDEFGPLFDAIRKADSRKMKGGTTQALEVGATALALSGLAAGAVYSSKQRRRNKENKKKCLDDINDAFSIKTPT